VLRVTNTANAPWIIVEGTDDAYRSLTVGRIVLDAMKRRLNQQGLQRCRWRRPSCIRSTRRTCSANST
jgi:hypothetical protein